MMEAEKWGGGGGAVTGKCHLRPPLHIDKPVREGLTLETTLEHARTTSTEKNQTGKSAGGWKQGLSPEEQEHSHTLVETT